MSDNTVMREYRCEDPMNFQATEEMQSAFTEDGYLLVRGLLSVGEVQKLQLAAVSEQLQSRKYPVPDPSGASMRMTLWQHPGKDFTGMLARCERVVNTAECVIGGEVYHYHTKLLMKEPLKGGEFSWHQDYGYWYDNGCLYPDMLTVFIAVDQTTRENGCLQILKGSHKCGRLDHSTAGGQKRADLERVEEIMKQLPLQYVEQQPGDALFFHSNLLHHSAQNTSEKRRYALAIAYNRASNNPVYVHHHPQYTPLEKVSNEALRDCQEFEDMSGKDFMVKNIRVAEENK